MHDAALEHPIAIAFALLLAGMLFRLVDIFVLRLDERWGEILVSKLILVALLLGFLLAAGSGLGASGLRTQALAPSVLLGVALTSAALVAGYAVDLLLAAKVGRHPAIAFLAIDPKSGLAGAAAFAVFLALGNVVNGFAEEGLFRGVMIPLFLRKAGPATALLSSALLFGAWHLPWAFKAALGRGGLLAGLAMMDVVGNFVPQALLGIVWGYLYLRTGNLWGPWVSHVLTNSALNFVHVRGAQGLDTGLPVRMSVYTLVMLLGLIVIQRVTQAHGVPPVARWAAEHAPSARASCRRGA